MKIWYPLYIPGATKVEVPISGTLVRAYSTNQQGTADWTLGNGAVQPEQAIFYCQTGTVNDLFFAIELQTPVRKGEILYSTVLCIVYIEA